jgi:hypothetical protein
MKQLLGFRRRDADCGLKVEVHETFLCSFEGEQVMSVELKDAIQPKPKDIRVDQLIRVRIEADRCRVAKKVQDGCRV